MDIPLETLREAGYIMREESQCPICLGVGLPEQIEELKEQVDELRVALKTIGTWCHFEPRHGFTSYADIENKCNQVLEDGSENEDRKTSGH